MSKLYIYLLCEKQNKIELIKEEIKKSKIGEVFFEIGNDLTSLKSIEKKYQLVIIDIDDIGMPSEDDRLSSAMRNTYFIYLSKSMTHLLESIGYNTLGYILYHDLSILSSKINLYLKTVTTISDCYFKTEEAIQLFKFKEIVYFELNDRKITMNTLVKNYRLVNYNLKDIMHILDKRFILINRSTIINKDYIHKVNYDHSIEIRYEKNRIQLNVSNDIIGKLSLNKKRGVLHKKKHIE